MWIKSCGYFPVAATLIEVGNAQCLCFPFGFLHLGQVHRPSVTCFIGTDATSLWVITKTVSQDYFPSFHLCSSEPNWQSNYILNNTIGLELVSARGRRLQHGLDIRMTRACPIIWQCVASQLCVKIYLALTGLEQCISNDWRIRAQ